MDVLKHLQKQFGHTQKELNSNMAEEKETKVAPEATPAAAKEATATQEVVNKNKNEAPRKDNKKPL